jgi:hypothetical protein
LGQGLDGIGFREHRSLPGEQCVVARAQARPVILGQLEMAAEVKQGDLVDLLACALGGDETVGHV